MTSSSMARPPVASATSRSRSRRRAPSTTLNPSLARRWAVAAPIPLDAPVTTATPRFMARRYRVPRRTGLWRRQVLDRRRGPAERLGEGDGEEGAGDPPLVAGQPVEHHVERVLEGLAHEPEEDEAGEDAGGQHDGVGAGRDVAGTGQEAHEVAAHHQEHDRQRRLVEPALDPADRLRGAAGLAFQPAQAPVAVPQAEQEEQRRPGWRAVPS